MFNLDQAITEWRQQMLAAGIKHPEALDELESHLREEVEHQISSGLNGSRAFQIAVEQIGQARPLQKEFVRAGGLKWALLRRWKELLLGSHEIPLPAREEFAPAAQQTLEFAPEEARRFHHDFIGTEHVLLGLTRLESGSLSNVMRRLGVQSEAVRKEIEKFVGISPEQAVAANIPFTPRARRALRLAADQARVLKQPRIKAEHIFLGLLLEGQGVAALVLKKLGVQPEQAREEVLREMRQDPGNA